MENLEKANKTQLRVSFSNILDFLNIRHTIYTLSRHMSDFISKTLPSVATVIIIIIIILKNNAGRPWPVRWMCHWLIPNLLYKENSMLCQCLCYELLSLAVVTCPALPAPPNGVRKGCTGTITERHNTVCHFSCYVGFNGMGSTTRTCLFNGSWSGQAFVCQGNHKLSWNFLL